MSKTCQRSAYSLQVVEQFFNCPGPLKSPLEGFSKWHNCHVRLLSDNNVQKSLLCCCQLTIYKIIFSEKNVACFVSDHLKSRTSALIRSCSKQTRAITLTHLPKSCCKYFKVLIDNSSKCFHKPANMHLTSHACALTWTCTSVNVQDWRPIQFSPWIAPLIASSYSVTMM